MIRAKDGVHTLTYHLRVVFVGTAGIVQGLPVAQRLAAYNVFRHRQLTLVPKKLLAEEVADSEQPKTKRVRFNF